MYIHTLTYIYIYLHIQIHMYTYKYIHICYIQRDTWALARRILPPTTSNNSTSVSPTILSCPCTKNTQLVIHHTFHKQILFENKVKQIWKMQILIFLCPWTNNARYVMHCTKNISNPLKTHKRNIFQKGHSHFIVPLSHIYMEAKSHGMPDL